MKRRNVVRRRANSGDCWTARYLSAEDVAGASVVIEAHHLRGRGLFRQPTKRSAPSGIPGRRLRRVAVSLRRAGRMIGRQLSIGAAVVDQRRGRLTELDRVD